MSVPVRRSYLRAADRRDHILDCALEAFAKAGFHDTSIADICARARIGRGTLYEHFQDKGAVLSALLDRIANRVIDVVRQWQPFELPADATWTAEDNVAFIEARCHMIMQVVFADADTASLILRMARGTGSARVTLARIDEQVVGAIAADVRAGIDQGILRQVEPDVTAQFIVGGIEKIVFGALEGGRTIDVARAVRGIAVLLSSGLLPGDRATVPPPKSRTGRRAATRR
jgi:TetR/AcrR family transcriptional regulator, fatty acid metabolism regulator protein